MTLGSTFASTNTAFAASDLAGIGTALDGISASAGKVNSALSKAFSEAVVNGKSLQSVLANLSTQLASLALQSATRSLLGELTGALGAGLAGLFGGGGTGLMGERGAEAIMPLARGPDGKLGVAAAGQGQRPVSVTVNIATQDAQSFQRSEAQVSAALARAVMRGQRSL